MFVRTVLQRSDTSIGDFVSQVRFLSSRRREVAQSVEQKYVRPVSTDCLFAPHGGEMVSTGYEGY